MSKDQNSLGIERRRFRAYLQYKDSGFAWLGKIPTHWEVRRLKTVASVQLSNVDKKSLEGQQLVGLCNYVDVYYNDFILFDMDFMSATATPEQVRRFSLRAGDVLITKDSESWTDIAVPALVSADLPNVLCGYHLALVRPADLDSGRFLAKAFSAIGPRDQFQIAANGITRFGLGGDAIRTSVFGMPPIQEQRVIASFLDHETAKIDALIEKKERLIELLQEKRTALITQAVTKGLDPTVTMKDSGVEWLGNIPEHWAIVSNKKLFEDSDIRSDYGDEELLTVSHLSGITRHSEKNVTMIEAESYEDYKICRAGELAINTMWAWMGALGMAKENGIVSPSYNVYALRTSFLDPRYYDYLCRTPLHIAELTRYSKGIWKSRLRLYPDGFFEISTPLPPINEQERIADQLDNAVRKIDGLLMTIRRALGCLKEYRTALISAAVTGKIDLREA